MRCEICGMKHATEYHIGGLEGSQAFLAVITHQYVKEPWHIKECQLASALQKPMIALVERRVDWSEYKEFPWVRIIEFDQGRDVPRLRKEIEATFKSLCAKSTDVWASAVWSKEKKREV